MATTGEWRNYIPTIGKVGGMLHYYLSGFMKGEPHPAHAEPDTKHNPLQRLAYLGIVAAGPLPDGDWLLVLHL